MWSEILEPTDFGIQAKYSYRYLCKWDVGMEREDEYEAVWVIWRKSGIKRMEREGFMHLYEIWGYEGNSQKKRKKKNGLIKSILCTAKTTTTNWGLKVGQKEPQYIKQSSLMIFIHFSHYGENN